MNDQIIWQRYLQQVESLSPESKVSRFCKEAGFMRVVEVGQYLVTKDTGNLRQFRLVACREYTLPRDEPASQTKGWIQGKLRGLDMHRKSRPVFKTANMGWPGGWGPQGVSQTGGGGLARVPNLRVCKHLIAGGGTRWRGR